MASVLVLAVVAPALAAQTVASRTAWTVSTVRTLAPGAGPAILQSEVTVTRDGLTRTLLLPGGRFGEVEQIVEGAAVPLEGEAIELSESGPSVRPLRALSAPRC